MKRLYLKEVFEKVVLVSGDGDYKMLVDFLIKEGRFEKILFPNKRYASSLYKSISRQYFAYLSDGDVKKKIGLKKKREPRQLTVRGSFRLNTISIYQIAS